MNADSQMIESIRKKNRQIEQMLNKEGSHAYESDESEGEYGEGDYQEQNDYYQQIKNMQLGHNQYDHEQEDEDGQDNYGYEQQNNENHQLNEYEDQNYYEPSSFSHGLNVQVNQNNEMNRKNEDSDHEDNSEALANMQSKFESMQMENGGMFDDDANIEQQIDSNPYPIKPKMETIEEGYSSDDSFGAQIKHKNFKENFEYVMQEK